jgi:hypothetical protein
MEDFESGIGAGISSDFNAEEEYKPMPLIPTGQYFANVTEVKIDEEAQAIVWTFVLADNGGLMSDGETSVDGTPITLKNWLPKPGDEEELTTSGKQTKRQAKINMLKQFADGMGVNMNTPMNILDAIANSEWIGLRAKLQISVREYEGRVFNEVRSAKAV